MTFLIPLIVHEKEACAGRLSPPWWVLAAGPTWLLCSTQHHHPLQQARGSSYHTRRILSHSFWSEKSKEMPDITTPITHKWQWGQPCVKVFCNLPWWLRVLQGRRCCWCSILSTQCSKITSDTALVLQLQEHAQPSPDWWCCL